MLQNVVIIDASTIMLDILPASAGFNYFDDGQGPYEPLLTTAGMTIPYCPDDTGCQGALVPRDAEDLCWSGEAHVIGSIEPADQFCDCSPADDPICLAWAEGAICDCVEEFFCETYGGTCSGGPPLLRAMGPPIPGGCVTFGGPTGERATLTKDRAVARATKLGAVITFHWEVAQFTVSHYNLLDVAHSDRRINHDPIAREGSNDGSTVHYAYVAESAQVRGARRFVLEMVLVTGERIRVPVGDESGGRP